MSSSSRRRLQCGCAWLLALCAGPLCQAQQTYFIPSVEVSAEQHTNRELQPVADLQDSSTAYIATLEALWGRRDERVDTYLRPRIRFQEYPDRKGIDPVEAFLDFQTRRRSLRGEYMLNAAFARQDSFNAEFGEAGFDGTDPEVPDRTDTGIVLVGNTRTAYDLRPAFQYQLSERTGLRGALEFQDVSFEKNSLADARVGFRDIYLEGLLSRRLGPRGDIAAGPYVSRYEAEDDLNTTDSFGFKVEWGYQWSELSHAAFDLLAERAEIDRPVAGGDESTTSFGLGFTGVRKLQVSSLRYSIGRFLEPSTRGGKTERDEIRLQYDRALSPRLSLKSAVRLGRDQLYGNNELQDRDLARAEIALRWMVSQTWFVGGGYKYAWQDRESAVGDADDNSVFAVMGYRALDRRQ